MSCKYVTPFLRYRFPEKSAVWLEHAFGMKIDDVARDCDGTIEHIAMRAGESSIIIGGTDGTHFDELLTLPEEVGGRGTQTCYLVIDDIESHRRLAEEAGATIKVEPQFHRDGDSYYACRDPEGHLWSFGTHQFSFSAVDGSNARSFPPPAFAAVLAGLARDHGTHGLLGIATAAAIVAIAGTALAYAKLDLGIGSKNSEIHSELHTKKKKIAALLAKSQDERHRRIRAEKAAEAAAQHRENVLAAAKQLRTKLRQVRGALFNAKHETAIAIVTKDKIEKAQAVSSEQSSVDQRVGRQQFLLLSDAYDQASTDLESARVREAIMQRRLSQTSQALDSIEKEAMQLKASRQLSAAAIRVAAQKLKEANALNARLRDMLARAGATIGETRLEKEEAKKALADLSLDFEKQSTDGRSRLAIASAELAEVSRQLRKERRRQKTAEQSLKDTARQLADVHAQATQMTTSVARLKRELNDKREKIRRFALLRHQDSETISVLSSPSRPTLVNRRTLVRSTSATKRARKISLQWNLSKESKDQGERKAPLRMQYKELPKQRKHKRKARFATTNTQVPKQALVGPLALRSKCEQAVWSSVLRKRNWSKATSTRVLHELCWGAQSSTEPARCFVTAMAKGIRSRAGSKRLSRGRALALCSGTRHAKARLDCFGRSTFSIGGHQAVFTCARDDLQKRSEYGTDIGG